MTIHVVNNEPKPAPAAATTSVVEQSGEAAPAAKAAEQKDASESAPEETEETESESDESAALASDDAESKDEPEADKPKKKGGFQRRIDKLNSQKAEAQKEAEFWRNQALKGKESDESKAPIVEKPKASEGKPVPDNFDTHTEYVEALTDWKTEQKFKDRETEQRKMQLQRDQETLVKSHFDRVATFKEKISDYQEVVEGVDDIAVSPTIEDMLISSENGPALIYELAKNREEYERINKLPPLAAARELGRLEARIASQSPDKKEPKKTTNAPKPIDPVGSRGASKLSKSIFDPGISQRDYEKVRREQMKSNSGF